MTKMQLLIEMSERFFYVGGTYDEHKFWDAFYSNKQ